MGRQRNVKKDGNVSKCHSKYNVLRRPNKTSDRERERVRGLSRAFSRLKTTLPWVPADTKLSKLDTLKLASYYIAYLVQLLKTDNETNDGETDGEFHPQYLVSAFKKVS